VVVGAPLSSIIKKSSKGRGWGGAVRGESESSKELKPRGRNVNKNLQNTIEEEGEKPRLENGTYVL